MHNTKVIKRFIILAEFIKKSKQNVKFLKYFKDTKVFDIKGYESLNESDMRLLSKEDYVDLKAKY